MSLIYEMISNYKIWSLVDYKNIEIIQCKSLWEGPMEQHQSVETNLDKISWIRKTNCENDLT